MISKRKKPNLVCFILQDSHGRGKIYLIIKRKLVNPRKVQMKLKKNQKHISRQKCLINLYFITGKEKAVLKYDPEN